jgi:Icc-related predicted phosphoesterase
MVIVGISDIHGDVGKLPAMAEQLCKADMVLVSGDLTTFGRLAEMRHIVGEIRIYNQNILAVPGNCDTSEGAKFLKDEGISLDRDARMLNGVLLAGIGGSLPGPGKTILESSEREFETAMDELGKKAESFAAQRFIFLAHQPPYGSVADAVGGSRHVGSEAMRKFILKYKPLACFCGHIHESAGVEMLENTYVINPGPLKAGGFGTLEIEDGRIRAQIAKA